MFMSLPATKVFVSLHEIKVLVFPAFLNCIELMYVQRRKVRAEIMATLTAMLLITFMGRMSGLVRATTHSVDAESLMQLKAAVNPASISETSCLGSWDFSVDPCDFAFTTSFICGLQCDDAVGTNQRRVLALTLDDAGYKGTLSPFVGNLSALEVLTVGRNAFGGSIPHTFSQLTNLQSLDLSGNQFTGVIPESLGHLINLTALSLSNNLLEGRIPSSISRLQNIAVLELNNNKLNGTIPPLYLLKQLRKFDASHNFLSCGLPYRLPPSLFELSLRNNQLTGPLPRTLNKLQELNALDLSSNQLGGSVATIFGGPSLEQLNLSYNRFTSLQASLRSVRNSSLVAVDLNFNQLHGHLPVNMAFMKRLSALSLQNNYFTGMIPVEYALKAVAAFEGVNSLQRLFLDGNYLVGRLPVPFLSLKDGQLVASFDNNCLQSCPANFTFCRGRGQRSVDECKAFFAKP